MTARPERASRGDRVPFARHPRLVTVDAKVNDLAVVMLVDTGAERMMISRSVAGRLAIDVNRPIRRESMHGVGASLPTPVVRLDRVRIGGAAAEGLLALVYDLPPLFRVDGVIGLNYLSQFRVTFEFDARELVLRPRRSYSLKMV